MLGLSIRAIITILIGSALVGLLALWFIVKKLNRIVRGIQKFSDGDLKTRIEVKSDDDLDQISTVFNSMADTIEQNIGELVHDVANKYRILSQKKGVNINTIVSKDTPVVQADVLLIDRVLQNLIDNAIRFCKEGDTINIEITSGELAYVSVTISDIGAGISQDHLPHIFERYFKNDDRGGSSGLGLAIVKRIIDLHDSSIDVKSIVGQGTTFNFSLPVAQIA